MAVGFRSLSGPTGNGGATNVAPDKPTGTLAGDLMVAYIVLGVAAKRTWTPPSGWVVVGSEDRQTGSFQSALFYKVAGASEPASYQFDFSGAAATGAGTICSFTGQNLTTPISTSNGQQNGASTTCTVPGITPVANSMLVMFMYNGVNAGFSSQAIATSNPTWTEQTDTLAGPGGIMVATATRPQATATGNATASCPNGANGGHLIAISVGDDVSVDVAVADLTIQTFVQMLPVSAITELTLTTFTPSISRWSPDSRNSDSVWTPDVRND